MYKPRSRVTNIKDLPFILFLLLSCLIWPYSSSAKEKLTMVIGTVPSWSSTVRYSEGTLNASKPGWQIEVMRRAASVCGADIKFSFQPWNSGLKMLQVGRLSAVFNSSFKQERTAYGVYPTENGAPDEGRASLNYDYSIYVHRDNADKDLIEHQTLENRTIGVEKEASIASTLKKRGAILLESQIYSSMLVMLAKKRVDAVVGISHRLDNILRKDLDLQSEVRKLDKPLETKVGFVMFSKSFYAQHPDLSECFWTRSATIMKTQWFKDMRASYYDN